MVNISKSFLFEGFCPLGNGSLLHDASLKQIAKQVLQIGGSTANKVEHSAEGCVHPKVNETRKSPSK